MKTITLTLLLIAATFTCNSQNWQTSFKQGQKIAKENNKLMLIDFWATWCGPCKTLDERVWSQETVIETMDKFVCIKIDVDENERLANKYSIKSIPAVILMDHNGEIVYKFNTISNPEVVINNLSTYPKNVSKVYMAMEKMEKQPISIDELFSADTILKSELKESDGNYKTYISVQNNKLLKQAKKLCAKNDQENLEKIELLIIYTDVLNNHNKKAIKQLVQKKGLEQLKEPNQKLAYQILSEAYLNEGLDKESEKYANML